jgi:hypothetical protein
MSPSPSRFSIGGVIGATFSTLFSRFVHFVPLALLCYVPVFLFMVFAGDFQSSSFGSTFESILGTVCFSIFAAIAAYEVVMLASGRPVTLGQTIAAITPQLGAVLLASFIYSLIVGFGTAFFIIPGLYFMTILFVVIPAIVVEGLGMRDGFARSLDLTSGYRWPIFGLSIILTLAALFMAFGLIMAAEALWPGASDNAGIMVGITAVVVMVGVMNAIATAHTFVRLRVAKEGASLEELADVFS